MEYEFRKLESKDVFLMTKIIGKIGINNFSGCLENDSVKSAIKKMTNKENNEDAFTVIGITLSLEIADVVFSNLNKCQDDIYQLLSQVSGVKVKDLERMDAVTFLEMIIDFIKKEEFKDFFKVASKLFR